MIYIPLTVYLSVLETESERQTFSELYARVKRKCIYVAFRITNDQALAEDAVHSAFQKIIERKENFFALPCHKQDSYIVITVKNKAIDMMRKRKPTDDLLGAFGEEAIASPQDTAADYESIETYERLKMLVQALPQIYRVVFEMKYLHDLDNQDIAEALDVSKSVVATRLKRARARLAEMIQKGGVTYEH